MNINEHKQSIQEKFSICITLLYCYSGCPYKYKTIRDLIHEHPTKIAVIMYTSDIAIQNSNQILGIWCSFCKDNALPFGLLMLPKQKKLPIKENTWPKGQATKKYGSKVQLCFKD